MMKAKLILILIAIIAVGSALGQTWQSGSLEDAQAQAKATGKLLLLDFFQEYG